MPQELAGRYHLEEELGGGGMAQVYKAQDCLLGRTAAIKLLREEYAQDEGFLLRFQQEARAAAGLSHPNIVTIYDQGEEGGHPYIVMEYLAGGSLKDLILREGPLTPGAAIRVALQICSGLDYAHERGIVHRDIKPQNILLAHAPGEGGQELRVKIADFGIARALGAASLSRTGEVLGSVHYLSPEQAKGEQATPASDLYSLGVLLYELLTNKLPFEGETTVGIALKHIQEEPPPLRQLNPRVPSGLESLVLRALAKEPSARYPSARAMAQSLREYAELGEEATGRLKAPPRVRERAPAAPGTALARRRRIDWLFVSLGVLTLFWLLGLLALAGALYRSYGAGPLPLGPPAAQSTVLTRIAVPGLLNLEADTAKKLIDGLGLRYQEAGSDYNELPAGRVIRQSPPEGDLLRPGDMVSVVVSLGPQLLSVPSLLGMRYEEAKEKLMAMGLSVVREEAWNPEVAVDLVFAQNPGPGERLPRGNAVALSVSKGRERVVVPDVVGKKEGEAEAIILQAGLRNSPYGPNYQGHDVLPDSLLRQVCIGCVLSTTPRAGTEVEPGTEIKMAVRKD